jgi:hypothetical protein
MTDETIKPFTDMYLIAALQVYGFEKVSIDRGDKNRQKFYFRDQKKSVWVLDDNLARLKALDLDEIEDAFISKKLMYPPSYSDVLKSIKYTIHSYK